MEVQRYTGVNHFDPGRIETIILKLGDLFNIRIAWDQNTALLTGACAVVGGLVGSYAGGRLGAAVGAAAASATGFGIATMVTLREIWATIKEKLQELLYIVFNFLRQLDPLDYMNAIEILMACASSRRQLVYAILDFIAVKLSCQVISSLTAA